VDHKCKAFFLDFLILFQGFMFSRQAFYHLSHAFSLFCSGYLEIGVLLFAQAGMDLDPSILGFLPSLG
jgi:hypothetical protein